MLPDCFDTSPRELLDIQVLPDTRQMPSSEGCWPQRGLCMREPGLCNWSTMQKHVESHFFSALV